MNLEYIRLTPEELFCSKRDLLQMELDFLLMVKKFEELRKIRQQKFLMKKELSKKIAFAQKAIADLEEEFPKIPEHEKVKETSPKKTTLDQEIDDVRQKLILLQKEIDDEDFE